MRLTLLTIVFASVLTGFASADEVTLKKNPHSVKATIGGDVFAVFQFDENRKKPFVLPVTAPGGFEILKAAKASDEPGVAGRKVVIAQENPKLRPDDNSQVGQTTSIGDVFVVDKIDGDWLHLPTLNASIHRTDVAPLVSTVTRLINDNPSKIKDRNSPLYYDHPHHKGVWLSVDEINGIKFWNEDGVIKNKSVEIVNETGNPAILKTVNHWVDGDGKALLEESTKISIFANRLMTYDVTFTAVDEGVEIGDTKEGMFAIRLPNSMREMVAGGPVINADGAEGTGEAWGRTSNWVDYKGPIDGHVFGVTLMDHPDNPWKSRYHVRNYGLFGVNPFGSGAYTQGSEEPHHRELSKGDTLQFIYGLYVHSGDTDKSEIEEVFEQFANN